MAFTPRAYPTLDEAVGRRSGFRLLFAGVALSIAVLASGLRTVAAVLVAIGTAYVGAGLFVAYLRLVLRWRLLEPDPRTIAPVEAMFPRDDLRAEVERDLARDGALGVVGTALWVLAVGLFFVLPCFVAAVVVVALARATPLPDLVALGYAAWPVVAPRLDLGRSLPEPLADVEAHLLRAASRCTESITGASLGLLVAFLGGLGAASHYGDRRGGVGRYALPGYAVASGVVMLLVRPLGGSAVATLLTVLSVVLLVGGGARAVVKYYGL